MKKFYIAGLVPEEEGGFSVYFPDVPNVAAGGNTVEETILMAEEGLQVALVAMAEAQEVIPVPSTLEAVKAAVKTERELDGLPYPENTLYQYIAAPSLDLVPVRINVSLPKSTLEAIDEKAKLYGYTRSGFLAHAAQTYHQDHA